MKRQAPKYNSLRDYVKSAAIDKESFDIKEQFDEALWYAQLTKLRNRERIVCGRDKVFYEGRINELRPLNGGSALIRFLQYKGLPKFCDFDCDGTVRKNYLKQGYYSWFPREIYRTLWRWQDLCRTEDVGFKFYTIKQFGRSCYESKMQMGPDTMNSFWITFSAYLISNYSDTYRWNNFKNTVFFKDGDNGRQRDRADRIKALIEADEDYIHSEGIKEFAKWTNTVGNLVLVPAGYNGSRGTQPCMKDYFDLSLENLACAWDENRYLGEDSETRRRNFIQYVNTFFLWEYVNRNYEPVPLCASHKKQMEMQRTTKKLEAKGVLPAKEEIDDLCSNINTRIRSRGLFVVAMLHIALGIDLEGRDISPGYVYDGKYRDEWADWNVTGVYKKIMEDVFLTQQVYAGGYGEVIDTIKERTAGNPDGEFVNAILQQTL